MKKNIFEGVKFKDEFLTRSGKVAVYQKTVMTDNNVRLHCLFSKDNDICVFNDGLKNHSEENEDDIISHYQEPIDKQT